MAMVEWPKRSWTCAYRKSNPGILVVQSAQDRATENASNLARLCATTNACACHCNSSCTRAARDADGVRRTQQHDQYIPAGLNRSAVLHKRFAKVSEETSVDLESRWIEPDAGISRRRRHRGPGSGNVGFAPSHTPPSVDWRSIRPSGAQ